MTDLIRPGETPRQALARLERLPAAEFTRVIETDAGQALMDALRRDHRATWRATRKGVAA
jgi:hypothetical protein